ncbi:hypothetical protein [Aquimarina sp. I32.4]|uniref:hypothetical protein n=1 Tax=Aquimarina sp. I32.4 TaxID=2053903 RepID=UPI000CDEE43A|nr:hypothetical protein [Aquimarina sp. I32.4]
MRKLTVLFVALLLGSTQLFASDTTSVNSEKLLRNQIETLLKNPEISLEQEEIKANIEFILNDKSEIVVLSVESGSEDDTVESYIKSRLNYKKINSNVSDIENRIFKISLKILKTYKSL